MSQWTHVAGIIRIDSMVAVMSRGPDSTEDNLRRRLGEIWNYDSDYIPTSNESTPSGSEGSIQYDIVKTGNEHSLSWGHIVIWGDLRDFDDPNEIYDWLLNSLATINEDGMGFRDVAISIDVEYQKQYIVFLEGEEQKLRMAVRVDNTEEEAVRQVKREDLKEDARQVEEDKARECLSRRQHPSLTDSERNPGLAGKQGE